jgi:hypothetical protein
MFLVFLLIQFPIDPFGTIITFMLVLIGTAIGLILYLLYMLLTFIPVFLLFVLSYAVLTSFVWALIQTFYFAIVVTVIVAVPYFFLWLVDMLTGGMVSRLMRCENSPDVWSEGNSFADNNLYSQWVPFCWRPCGKRYRPIYGGTCCQRLPKYLPDHCPQQQIYRTFVSSSKGRGTPSSTGGPDTFVDYLPEAGFAGKDPAGRQRMMASAFKEKVKWYQRCYTTFSGYDFINRHLCDNVDLLPTSKDEDATARIVTSCREIFCNYQPTSSPVRTTITTSSTHDYKFELSTSTATARMTPRSLVRYQRDAPGGGNMKSCDRLNSKAGELSELGDDPASGLLRAVLIISIVVVTTSILLVSVVSAFKKGRPDLVEITNDFLENS